MQHATRTSRAAALAALGALVVGALTLGAAAPANAVDVDGLRAYQQTLPASVIDQPGLTDEQRAAWTNATRSGNVTKPLVPVAPYTYTKPGGGAGATLFKGGGALGMLMMIDGVMQAQESLGEYWWKDVEKPSGVDQAEWDACKNGGDASNFFDGMNDWVASMTDIFDFNPDVDPIDCAAARADWELDRNPDYQPVGSVGGPAGFPYTRSYGYPYNTSVTYGVPFYSTHAYSTQYPGRAEGWVIPVNYTGGTPGASLTINWINAAGTVIGSYVTPQIQQNWTTPELKTLYPQCAASNGCLSLARTGSIGTYKPSGAVTAVLGELGGVTFAPLPYVDPFNGATPIGELARQVLLTAVRTEAGNLYQCRTESFVETAPTVPRPCEPEVPDWEIITERTVEIVPETDPGYVPGSNPSRGIQTTTVPDVVRDWDRDHDAETLYLLDLELEGVGSCFDHPDECADWYTDPNKNSKYTCSDGAVTYALDECRKYARIFKPGAISTGTAYPAPGPNPTAPPATPTSTTPGPSVPPGTQPSDPTKSRQCFPTGWGVLNPFEWVFKPVKCAMEWAFVPRADVVKQYGNQLRLKWTASSLVGLLSVFESATTMFVSADGCEGPAVNLDAPKFGISYAGHPLSACDQPMAGIASFSFIFTGVVAWVMALGSISRSIAGVVAFRGIGGDD